MAELKLGYKASAEQFAPRELVELAVEAEAHGMDSATVSDHFQPWRHEGGHAPFSLAWMTAVGERTKRLVLGTSVLTPTFRYNPAVIAQAFATMGCLYPDRIFLGVGTGESLNEIATGYEGEWPEFKERYARLRESVRLMRELWLGDRVDFEGEYYKTKGASIYDVPEGGIPIYIAAGGPQVAKYAGRAGDGFICTSGKGEELYKDKLIPAMREGAEAAGKNPDDVDRMIEIKISYDTDPEAGAGEHPVLGAAVADRRAEAPASTTRSRWRRPPTSCPSSRSPSAGSSRRIPTRPSPRSSRLRGLGTQPPGLPRPRPRPAPLPRALQEGSGAAAAQARLIWQAGTRDPNECFGHLHRVAGRGHRKVDDRAGHPAPARGDRRQGGGVPARSPGMGEDRDYILELLLAHTTAGLSYEECVGVGYQQLHDDPDSALVGHRRPLPPGRRTVRRRPDRRQRLHRRRLAERAVASTRASPSTSARPIVLAVRAADRTPDDVAHVVELCLAEIAGQHAHTAAVVANRCDPAELDARSPRRSSASRRRATCCRRSRCWSRRRSRELSDAVARHGDQRRRGPAEPRGAGRAGRGHDRRARAGAAARGHGGDHARATAPTSCWRSRAPMRQRAFRRCRA